MRSFEVWYALCADDIAAAFSKVDELLLAATAAAPAVALLAARAAEHSVSETKLANHLRTNPAVLRWVMKLEPAAASDRSIDLEAADADLADLLLRWARRLMVGRPGCLWWPPMASRPRFGLGRVQTRRSWVQ